jgi:phosphate transport system permease protein
MRRWRSVKDGMSKYVVGTGGISVIIALGLIFVYLAYEVVPLFYPAWVTEAATYRVPGPTDANTLHIATERHLEYAVRFTDDGTVTFFLTETGEVERQIELPIPDGVSITSFAAGEPRSRLVGLGLSDGTVLLLKHTYEEVFDE